MQRAEDTARALVPVRGQDFNMSGSAIPAAEKDKAQKILNEVIKLPDNKMCADCNSLGPRWASMNLGVCCPSPPSRPRACAVCLVPRGARVCWRADGWMGGWVRNRCARA